MTRSLLPLLLTTLTGAAMAATLDEGIAAMKVERLPEAELIFHQVLADQPDDVETLARLATVQGWQKKYPESVASWERAISLATERMDLRIGLARTCYWSGNYARARRNLTYILAAQPENVEALTLAGDVAAADGDPGVAVWSYREAQRREPANPDVTAKLQRFELGVGSEGSASKRWRLDSTIGFDRFSTPVRDQEQSAATQLSRSLTAGWTVGGGIEWLEPYKVQEQRYNVEASWAPNLDWLLSFRLAASSGPEILPKRELIAGMEFHQLKTIAPTFQVHYRNYSGLEATTSTFGTWVSLEDKGMLHVAWAITGYTNQDTTHVAIARWTRDINRWHPMAILSYGTENLPPEARTQVASLAIGAGYDVDPVLRLNVNGSLEDRRRQYSRQGFTVGVTAKF